MARCVGILVAVSLLLLPTSGGYIQVARAECAVEFGRHMLDLRSGIGDAMGQPLDCEQALDGLGDTVQATSTGTAWSTTTSKAAMFTDGTIAGSSTRRGLTYWGTPDAIPLLLDGLADGPAVWNKAATCPVLYTHEVPSIAGFRSFVNGLLRAGFQPVSFGLVDASMRGEGDLPSGCVVLSFDDALASQLRNAVPVLTELGLTGHVLCHASLPGQSPSVSDRRGYSSAARCRADRWRSHLQPPQPAPARPRRHDGGAERLQTPDRGHLGVPVRYLAYPNGAVNQIVLEATAQAGYRAAFTTRASVGFGPTSRSCCLGSTTTPARERPR